MDKILETDRLMLRKITQADFHDWQQILSDPITMQYYPAPYDEKGVQRWVDWTLGNYEAYGFGLWAVILKESGAFIGDCGITMQNIYGDGKLLPEVGFHFNRAHWRRGYATEAAKTVMDYAFRQFDFDALYCYQNSENIPSRKTAEKIGMHCVAEYADEKEGQTSVYRITREECT